MKNRGLNVVHTCRSRTGDVDMHHGLIRRLGRQLSSKHKHTPAATEALIFL
jgi:hypothetical protein